MTPLDFWTPFYGARYIADTKHLDLCHHGAYLLLLIQYWAKGPLPDDDGELARIVGTDLRTWRKIIAPKLRPFFTTRDGKLHQKRADIERARAADISSKRRNAANKRHANAHANAPPEAPPDASPNASAFADAEASHPVPITQYPLTSTKGKGLINKNPLPSKDLVGSRARENEPDGIEALHQIERRDDEKLSDNPAIEAHIRRTAKACQMHTDDYGQVRSRSQQIEAILSPPEVVGEGEIIPPPCRLGPVDPVRTPEEQIAMLTAMMAERVPA